MRSLFALMLVCAALGLAGCAGEDTTTTTTPPPANEPADTAPADDATAPADDAATEG
jgi:hypothetical protein